MAKFGKLIDVKEPVLLLFHTTLDPECSNVHAVLQEVAAYYGPDIKVIKIDVDKNKELSKALLIKVLPTMLIYKNGEQKEALIGFRTLETLTKIIEPYLRIKN